MIDTRQQAFLVRTWAEPRERATGVSPQRYYVRHLATGEEWYLREAADLEAVLSAPDRLSSRRSAAAAAGERSSRC